MLIARELDRIGDFPLARAGREPVLRSCDVTSRGRGNVSPWETDVNLPPPSETSSIRMIRTNSAVAIANRCQIIIVHGFGYMPADVLDVPQLGKRKSRRQWAILVGAFCALPIGPSRHIDVDH